MSGKRRSATLEVLEYLFDRYLPAEAEFAAADTSNMVASEFDSPDDTAVTLLAEELASAGFSPNGIARAFVWLEDMWAMCDAASDAEEKCKKKNSERVVAVKRARAIRQYSGAERAAIGTEAQGLFLSLERAGIMDDHTREIVIDRLMALEEENMALEDVKWVVLLVLGNHPQKRDIVDRAEDMMLDHAPGRLH